MREAIDSQVQQLHDAGQTMVQHIIDAAQRIQISDTLVNTIGIGLFVSFIWVLAWALNRPPRYREIDVAKDRNADLREIRVKALLADIITDGVENAVFEHALTRDESRWAYFAIGHALKINDLIPKKRKDFEKLPKAKIADLKAKIKARLKNGHQEETKTNVVPIKKLGSMLKR